MTIHASKGQQADYVILLGLQQGKEASRQRRANRLLNRAYYRSQKRSLMQKSAVWPMWH